MTADAPVPLRLVVKLRMFDLSWNPSLPAETLLAQARDLAEAGLPLDALYNATQEHEIDLKKPLAHSVAPNDVVEAKSLLEMPDDSYASLPWLSATTSADGLFYQQLCAMAIVGQRENRRAAKEKRLAEKQADHLLSLFALYLQTSPDQPNLEPEAPRVVRSRRAASAPAPVIAPPSPMRSPEPLTSPEHDVGAFTDSDTDDLPPSPPRSAPRAVVAVPPPAIKVAKPPEEIFDVVFTQKSIGLKLIIDDAKRFAIVRECMDGSEASRYPDIRPGVAVLAVNGQSVHGIGLNRTLSRLREAPRPVVVRFGHSTKAKGGSWSDLL
ncbi:hypothetical protein ACHHYP_00105 [Achlya hypogyna]|uniref:PDZ domain-containing protein n=1 Tax=Achlya hypogyna TaxID=1202772 RepID=A0A1V9ZBD8_ACHHY|nr:hypothetical protein ACHHYP_00105 [Achlya hypogyna]